jgi:autotransporter-associated beta strand protein
MSVNQPAAPEVAQGKAKQQLQESQIAQIVAPGATYDLAGGQVARYQERLQAQQAAQQDAESRSLVMYDFLGTITPPTSQQVANQYGGTVGSIPGSGGPQPQPPAQPGMSYWTAGGGPESAAGKSSYGVINRRVQGPVTVTKAGSGTVVLGDRKDFTGNTVVTSGTLRLPSPAQPGHAGVQVQSTFKLGEAVASAAGGGGAPAGPPTPQRPPATGLASLDLAMPTCDGIYEVYRFTTPRGEVEITARAFSRERASRLARLAATAVVFLLLLAVVQIACRGGLRWLGGGPGSTLLIAYGLLALVLGIFPLAAAAALTAGWAIKIRRFFARRAASVQPAAVKPAEG